MTPHKILARALFALIAILVPISFSYHAPQSPTIQTGPITTITTSSVSPLVPIFSEAFARVRIDPGLPMTNVPYRYSTYLFILAVITSKIYINVRKKRQSDEMQLKM